MTKHSFASLFLLMSLISFSCISTILPGYTLEIGHHISDLSLNKTDIYFGAGYCLYSLSTSVKTIQKLFCQDDWLFQRPAINEKFAFSQVLLSPSRGQFAVAIDLRQQKIEWKVDEEGNSAYFGELKQGTFLQNDKVVITRREGIDALSSATGKYIWQSEPSYMTRKPILFEGSLWYTFLPIHSSNNDGTIIVQDINTGRTIRFISLSQKRTFSSLLAISHEWLVGLDDNQYLVAVNLDLLHQGEIAWVSNERNLIGNIEVSIYGNQLVITTFDSAYAVNISSNEIEWLFKPNVNSKIETNGTVDNNVYTIIHPDLPVSKRSCLYALDRDKGTEQWVYCFGDSIEGDPSPSFVKTGDEIYVSNVNKIDILDANSGKLLKSLPLDSEYKFYKSSSDN